MGTRIGPPQGEIRGELEGSHPCRVQKQKILERGREGSDLVPRPEIGNNLVSKKRVPATFNDEISSKDSCTRVLHSRTHHRNGLNFNVN